MAMVTSRPPRSGNPAASSCFSSIASVTSVATASSVGANSVAAASRVGATSSTASYFRGRINFDLTSNIYRAYFQLQDSRLLGDQFSSAGQTGLDNTYPTFHQFYGQINGPLNGKNKIRFGRFEMPLGNQRIFARSNWGNYGRSFEGITNTRNTRQGNILFFHLINTDLYPMNDQFDYIVDGFDGTSNIRSFRKGTTQTIESEKIEPFLFVFFCCG